MHKSNTHTYNIITLYIIKMTNQFSEMVSKILQMSRQEALICQSKEVKPIHLLLAMFRAHSPLISNIINKAHVDSTHLQQVLDQYGRGHDDMQNVKADNVPFAEASNDIVRDAITNAFFDLQDVVTEEHLLKAMLNPEKPNEVQDMLEKNNINIRNIEDSIEADTLEKEAVSDSISYSGDNDDPDSLFGDDADDEDVRAHGSDNNMRKSSAATHGNQKTKTPILDHYSHDLTKAAADGVLDPVVGREKEIARVVEILGRRKKNNPILIGEPGVGKSAIVEGLAQLINKQQVSATLFNKRVVELDMAAIVAGTKYRGQFEDRIKGLIKELEADPNIIIFIDEIHTIIGAGNAEGSMDAANILKPALARGVIQCIGATTLNEYRKSIEKDGALERRFQKVTVNPTTPEETLQILRNIKERYEQHHGVTYTEDALTACVKLTDRYVTDRFFPDKAIDVIDEVGSHVHLAHSSVPQPIIDKQEEIDNVKANKQKAVANQNFELAASYRDQQTMLENQLESMKLKWENGETEHRVPITEKDVADVVSRMTGIPVQRMEEAESVRLRKMSDVLKSTVIAQDKAIDTMVKAIRRNRVGLKEPNHPIGAFMFLGPTGVGKTYLAKKLAEQMFGSADALIRIDMSEYSESFNTSRLVGAPPGYVGYDEGGQLTEKVRRKPYSIVLLDEIEKANGKVFNLLLQVLDEGRLTDGNGRLIDFRNTIIIMTSNAGTRQLKEFGRGVGFNAGRLGDTTMDEKDKEYARSIIQKSLSKQFSPEFLNRLDEIITFDQLDLDAIKRIIDIELASLFKRINEMGYNIRITDKAKEFVATKGYDIQFGARPLKRAIQTYVEDGVCELLLSDNLKPGDTIVVGKNPNKEELTISNKE